jgi:hypothetical protein
VPEVQRPKILLAAVVVVAGVIGISGIYPQVIDAEWTQDSGTHLPKISLLTTSTSMKASATATALSSRGRHVVTTGSPPRPAPAPDTHSGYDPMTRVARPTILSPGSASTLGDLWRFRTPPHPHYLLSHGVTTVS